MRFELHLSSILQEKNTMKKIAALIIIASLGLAGCNEEKPSAEKVTEANNKLMKMNPIPMPTPPAPPQKKQ